MMETEFDISYQNYTLSFISELDIKAEDYKKWLSLGVESVCEYFAEYKNFHFNISVSLIDDDSMREINLEHRAKDKTTDVLSFPMQESIRESEFDTFDNQVEMGDLLICLDVCSRQAHENNISYFDEFIHLFFHGYLHLMGYDHEINEDEDKLMRRLEQELIELCSKKKGAK